MASGVEHVFVLMLENRSFDHLFGFSDLRGNDAETGGETAIVGLDGSESNALDGTSYPVTRGGDFAMPIDPGHEFDNVLDQLCGPGIVAYAPPYPPLTSAGFVDSYVRSGGRADPAEVMRCFDTPRQLPVLYALAEEFALCDGWFSSMPGPTWPNRMFVHAASSSGLDHSPTTAEILEWETVEGFAFRGGTVFGALTASGKRYGLYSGDDFPMVAALKGIDLLDVHRIEDLLAHLAEDAFPYDYVFIEPSYNILDDYRNSSSQHPLADVRGGEALVKTVYEALRASPIWERSLLVVAWDEHGGFYDHVPPPAAVPPGDTEPGSKYNRFGFTFERYGVRTPAIVVSPRIPRNTIDHRVYDHASIPATLEAVFGLRPLTARDAGARNLLSLLSLATPRASRSTLPAPFGSADALDAAGASVAVSRPNDSIDGGMLPAVVHAALCHALTAEPARKVEILATVAALQTRDDAMKWLASVRGRLRAVAP